MSSCTKIDSKKKDILIVRKGPAEIHCLQKKCIQLILLKITKHYDWTRIIMVQTAIFVNVKEIYKFKAKDSEVVANPLCLGNISKDWAGDNMKNIGLNGYVYDFSADYDAIAVDGIFDIHKYLMKKNNMI